MTDQHQTQEQRLKAATERFESLFGQFFAPPASLMSELEFDFIQARVAEEMAA